MGHKIIKEGKGAPFSTFFSKIVFWVSTYRVPIHLHKPLVKHVQVPYVCLCFFLVLLFLCFLCVLFFGLLVFKFQSPGLGKSMCCKYVIFYWFYGCGVETGRSNPWKIWGFWWFWAWAPKNHKNHMQNSSINVKMVKNPGERGYFMIFRIFRGFFYNTNPSGEGPFGAACGVFGDSPVGRGQPTSRQKLKNSGLW